MRPFKVLAALAAPYPVDNIDTDRIIPARFLKTVAKSGLGEALFADVRRDAHGVVVDDFILNIAPWNDAGILVAGENFGCGSSREHAPWALLDFGIRCIIAPSFAEIFYNNCFKNGILPIALPVADWEVMLAASGEVDTAYMTIDLSARTIRLRDGRTIDFAIEDERATALMEGRDEIASSLLHRAKTIAFEKRRLAKHGWLRTHATG